MVKGYQRRNRAQGVYFREMYALSYNLFQAKNAKSPAFIRADEVITLPGETPKRAKQGEKKPKVRRVTQAQLNAMMLKAANAPTVPLADQTTPIPNP